MTSTPRDDPDDVRAALDRELASCTEDEPPWPNVGEQGPVTEAVLQAMDDLAS